jgi:hypothetical protein
MKKFVFASSIIIVFLLSLTFFINPNEQKAQIAIMKANADYMFEMHTHPCKNGGTYKRCDPVNYSSYCDVHDQTLCPEQQ